MFLGVLSVLAVVVAGCVIIETSLEKNTCEIARIFLYLKNPFYSSMSIVNFGSKLNHRLRVKAASPRLRAINPCLSIIIEYTSTLGVLSQPM